VVKLLYIPFAVLAGLISKRLGRSVFRSVWAKIDDQPPPKPRSGDASAAKVVGAQALQAAVMAGVTAAVNRAFAVSFHHLVGAWPDKQHEPDEVTKD
jgi:Protein of unknown function (DUF4235)